MCGRKMHLIFVAVEHMKKENEKMAAKYKIGHIEIFLLLFGNLRVLGVVL